jgi:hypothetical protein
MIDERIHVAIKSYRRAGKVRTLDIAPFAHVWVPESQGEEYRRYYGDRVITIPDDQDGNLCRKSNAILDRSPCPWTLILDDDVSEIGFWDDGRHYKASPEYLEEMIIDSFLLADEVGVKLWGINQVKDSLAYRTYTPIAFLSPILGPFNGHLAPVLRYDESVLGKDDYDFWLQNIRKYHRTLRINRFHYMNDHGKMSGGFVSMRTMDAEEKGAARMMEKWGKVYKAGGGAGGREVRGGRGNILNSTIKVPIPGC